MADILIQFHALPEELLPIVLQCVTKSGLHAVAVRYFPFEAVEISSDDLVHLFSPYSSCREVILTLDAPVLNVATAGELADRNPDRLRLVIGRRVEEGLNESSLTARTSNNKALAVWKEVATHLKRVTQAGAVAVNRETKATALLRNHRFTQGAKRAELEGIPILPVAGGSFIKLGSP